MRTRACNIATVLCLCLLAVLSSCRKEDAYNADEESIIRLGLYGDVPQQAPVTPDSKAFSYAGAGEGAQGGQCEDALEFISEDGTLPLAISASEEPFPVATEDGAATRAEHVTTANLATLEPFKTQGIKVCAFFNALRDDIPDGTAFDDITKASGFAITNGIYRPEWDSSKSKYFWYKREWSDYFPPDEGALYDFAAIAPSNAAVSNLCYVNRLDYDGSFSDVPVDDPDNVTFAPFTAPVAAANVGKGFRFDYTTPTAAQSQYDIIVAYATLEQQNPVPITFRHAMASVSFRLANIVGCKLVSLKLTSVKTTGRCTFDDTSVFWTDVATARDFTHTIGTTFDDSLKSPGDTTAFRPVFSESEAESKTFMFLPQSLGPENVLRVEIQVNDEVAGTQTKVWNIDLSTIIPAGASSAKWEAGKHYTYDISTNPSAINWTYKLEFRNTDGVTPLSDADSVFLFPHTGGSIYAYSYKYRSYSSGAVGRSPVNCKVEYSLSGRDGTWSTSLPSGATGFSYSSNVSSQKRRYSLNVNRPSKVSSTPASLMDTISENWDLSFADGRTDNPAGRSTANCYVVNAQNTGTSKYLIPCVYGNSIVRGNTNHYAYDPIPGLSDASTGTFEGFDFSGNNVSWYNLFSHSVSPFPGYDGTGISGPICPAGASAALIWQDSAGMITDVALESGTLVLDGITRSCQYITFKLAQKVQGNAVIALKDSAGKVIWSWYLWATDYHPGTGDNEHGSYYYAQHPIGWALTGTADTYPALNLWVRVTQSGVGLGQEHDPDKPYSRIFRFVRSSYSEEPATGTYTVYQWGRKDPFTTRTSAVTGSGSACYSSSTWYGRSAITYDFNTSNIPYPGAMEEFGVSYWIQHPEYFLRTAASGMPIVANPFYLNLWDGTLAERKRTEDRASNSKTVYDPCPAGYKVPPALANKGLTATSNSIYTVSGVKRAMYITTNGVRSFFQFGGELQSNGVLANDGESRYWGAAPTRNDLASADYLAYLGLWSPGQDYYTLYKPYWVSYLHVNQTSGRSENYYNYGQGNALPVRCVKE